MKSQLTENLLPTILIIVPFFNAKHFMIPVSQM